MGENRFRKLAHKRQHLALNSGRHVMQRIGAGIAILYLIFLTAIYFYIPFCDPGYEYGGLRLILYTLPWGLVGQLPAAIGAIAPRLIGEFVSYLVFVVLSGDANAYILMRVFGYRPSRRLIAVLAAIGCVIAIAAQLTAVVCARAAMNYHWPANVPKAAVLIPNMSGGSYQTCDFEADGQKAHCRIWNFGGETLYDEEFVPLDSQRSITAHQLRIVDQASGPDRVTLKNGRVLDRSRTRQRPFGGRLCCGRELASVE